MNTVLSVKNLTKSYDTFRLDNISFDIEKGEIAGFIGRNGAGKTTTIKTIAPTTALLFPIKSCQTDWRNVLLSTAINSSFFSSSFNFRNNFSSIAFMSVSSFYNDFLTRGSTIEQIRSDNKLQTIMIAPMKIVIPITTV